MEQGDKTDIFLDNKEAATPPSCLCGKIMNRIRAEKKFEVVRKRTVFFVFALFGSAIAFLAAFLSLEGALAESQIFKLLSLIVSDPLSIAANWLDFGSFLLESLPVVYLAVFLTTLLVLLESLKYAAKYASDTFSFSKLVKSN